MTKKKSNPVMTPEWFASLLETCSIENPEERADHTPLGPPPKLHPHLQELLDGLPMPDGTVAKARPGVIAREIKAFSGVVLNEDAARAFAEMFDQLTDYPPKDLYEDLYPYVRQVFEHEMRHVEAGNCSFDDLLRNMGDMYGSKQSTAPPPPDDEYGGGGMSGAGIKLMDMYYTILRLLADDSITNREVREFTEAVERLIRK